MCVFLIECFSGYIKSVSDRIMGVICCITSTTGIILIIAKKKHISLIDDNLTWTEVAMPLVVGTGGCVIYNIICYGIKRLWTRKPPEYAIELP